MVKVTCIECNATYEVGDGGSNSTKRCPPCQKERVKAYNTIYRRRHRAGVRYLKKRGIPYKPPVSVSALNESFIAYFTPDGERVIETDVHIPSARRGDR